MIDKTKAAGRANATAAYKRKSHRNHTPIASFVKGFIVDLALRGLLPCKAAEWLIQRGGCAMHEADNIRAALSFVPAYDRDLWLRIGMAIKSELSDEGYSLWAEWSEQCPSWNERDGRAVWRSIKPNGKVTIATLFYEAHKRGFRRDGLNRPSVVTPEEQATRQCAIEQTEANEATEEQQRAWAALKAMAIWKVAQPLAEDHPYLVRKHIKPVSTLREIPVRRAKAILGYTPKHKDKPLTGRLIVIPVKINGWLSTLELIDEQGRKTALFGGAKAGGYWAAQPLPEGDGQGETLLIGEGVATVLSATEATGHPVIATLSCCNLANVAKHMRERYPAAAIVILADLGKDQAKTEQAARSTGALLAIPKFGDNPPENATDFHDLAQHHGLASPRCRATGTGTSRLRIQILSWHKEQAPPVGSHTMVRAYEQDGLRRLKHHLRAVSH